MSLHYPGTRTSNRQHREEDIKSAYHVQARQHHPDRGGDQQQWHRVQAAYEQALAQVA